MTSFDQGGMGYGVVEAELSKIFNLHTVHDCPGGTFLGAGVKTVVLFFEKGAPTRQVWFNQLVSKTPQTYCGHGRRPTSAPPGRNFTKKFICEA
jgi:type I restriction-modification system DNA methylase subunit